MVPAGMHITSRITADEKDNEPDGVIGQGASVYPFGIGGLLMNGCYGSGYEPGDPCFDATWTTDLCLVNSPGHLKLFT